jgi:hypothetical protein
MMVCLLIRIGVGGSLMWLLVIEWYAKLRHSNTCRYPEDTPKISHPKITVFLYQILATKAEDCRFVIISLLFLIISTSIAPMGVEI